MLIKIKKFIKYKRKYKKSCNSFVHFKAILNKNTILEGDNFIYEYVDISDSNIGYATAIGIYSNLSNCSIGRFCSIANNVHVQKFTHPINFVSTYPGFYDSVNNYPFGKSKNHFEEFLKCSNGKNANIGNDVWIGENVIIKGGVTIGDGAIIGMGAVVTKDIPPYAVVGGIPAKIIKYRFDENTINKLLSIKWWNWDHKLIQTRKDEFSNLSNFLNRYSK